MQRPTDRERPAPAAARLVGVLCTYRRPEALSRFLDLLDEQDRRPDLVIVVDNGNDDRVRHQVAEHASSFPLRYRAPEVNVGPAGAFAMVHRELADELGPEDLVVHLDDDDPPADPALLDELIHALQTAARADQRVAGIGLSGGRLNTRTGIIARVTGGPRLEEVDHLHGGYLPIYRFAALRDVGGSDATFFYGFEELELGRRLHLAGWKLLVHNELMQKVRDRYPKRAPKPQRLSSGDRSDADWSRFHKERNLVRVLARERHWWAILVTVLVRHIAVPALAIPRARRRAVRRAVLGVRATVAGLRRSGGIDHRYRPPA